MLTLLVNEAFPIVLNELQKVTLLATFRFFSMTTLSQKVATPYVSRLLHKVTLLLTSNPWSI